MAKVTRVIPYKPRYLEVHNKLESHRFSVLVAHRRFGKTVLTVNHLLKQAWLCRRPRGFFAYVAPFRNQAKQIAWNYLKHYSEPIPNRAVNEGELSVKFPSGASIRIFGADNPDALRGLYFDGVVLDEVAQMKAEVWEEIVRPALADRKGWAVFIGTPKGINLFQELYLRAQAEESTGKGEWCAMMFRVDQTHAIDEEELKSLRREMSEARFAQEFMCDFNASSEDILIPMGLATEAQHRHLEHGSYEHMPLIMGVDVARFGDDASVITFRRGVYCEEQLAMRNLSTMELSGRVAELYRERKPNAVFVDGIGVGAGVVDRLKELGIPVIDAQAGARALHPDKYVNRRAEMWVAMRDWLKTGVIPPDPVLMADLTTLTYSYNSAGALVLEKKEDAKERLQRSPDRADSLALTFYAPVFSDAGNAPRVADMTYDPLAW